MLLEFNEYKKKYMKTWILYCNRSSAWVYYICSRKGATSEQGATFINVIILMIFVRMCCAGVGVARIVKKKPETSRRIMNQIARISLLWRGVLYHNGYFFLFSASIEPISHKERIYQIGYCKADRTMHNAYNTLTNLSVFFFFWSCPQLPRSESKAQFDDLF